MDFSLTEEQLMFRDLFRDFAQKEVAKVAEHTDHAEEPPLEMLKKAAQQGFLGATIPEEYGGAGLNQLTYTLLLEEVAKECMSSAITIAMHTSLAAMTVLDAGTDAQKQQYLPRLAGGELGAFALNEPDSGSDVSGLQTRAVFANGHYHLDGVKNWVSNGGLAFLHVVFANTDAKKKLNGVSAFLVEGKAPFLTLGKREPTLGLRGLDVRTVYYEGGVLPETALLGQLNDAGALISRAKDRLHLALAAVALGCAEGALNLGVKFAAERKQFGVAIAQKQAIQNFIADAKIEIEALRHLVQHAAWLADEGQPFSAAANIAKYHGARAAREISNRMLQVHGGYGFSDEYTISRVFRDARALKLMGTTDEVGRYLVAHDVFNEAGVTIAP